MKGTNDETTETITKMLTLGLVIIQSIVFRAKVSIFVRVWVVSAILSFTRYPLPLNPYPPLPEWSCQFYILKRFFVIS